MCGAGLASCACDRRRHGGGGGGTRREGGKILTVGDSKREEEGGEAAAQARRCAGEAIARASCDQHQSHGSGTVQVREHWERTSVCITSDSSSA